MFGAIPQITVVRAIVMANMGRTDEARAELPALEMAMADGQLDGAVFAGLLAALGDTDGAFALLEAGYARRDANLIALRIIPFLAPLRDDPRFADLARRIGLPD